MAKADPDLVVKLKEKSKDIAKQLCDMTFHIGTAHVGGSLSMCDFTVALYYHFMNFDPEDLKNPDRDRLYLSKGHNGCLIYNIFAATENCKKAPTGKRSCFRRTTNTAISLRSSTTMVYKEMIIHPIRSIWSPWWTGGQPLDGMFAKLRTATTCSRLLMRLNRSRPRIRRKSAHRSA